MTGVNFLPLRLQPQPARPAVVQVRRSGPPMFLFCIGAAKCGSAWLFNYLRKHPECHVRAAKEVRFFSDLEDGALDVGIGRIEHIAKQVEDAMLQAPPKERAEKAADLLDLRDYLRVLHTCKQDKYAYVRYMMAGLRNEKLVADVTPDYARLTGEMFRRLVGVANDTRFVFVMRDPVERLWSHVRMETKFDLVKGADFNSEASARLALALAGKDKIMTTRYSDYADTLAKLEAMVPAERRLVMFYEDLMTQPGLKKLCKFLGIKPMKGELERVVHGGRSAAMTEDERAAARRFLRPQYEAVASRFPVLPKNWQNTMDEGFA